MAARLERPASLPRISRAAIAPRMRHTNSIRTRALGAWRAIASASSPKSFISRGLAQRAFCWFFILLANPFFRAQKQPQGALSRRVAYLGCRTQVLVPTKDLRQYPQL